MVPIFLLSPAGGVYHEWNGYLPPTDYLAELELGLGKAQLRERRFGRAATIFEDLRDNRPRSHVAAEATYWAAVARYNESDQAGRADGRLAEAARPLSGEHLAREAADVRAGRGPTSSRPRSR